jgi:hypothetical protein
MTADTGIEITGNTSGKAVVVVKTKSGDEWTLSSFDVDWADLQITATATETPATEFPASWQGMYDFSLEADSSNNAGVESWFSINSEDERGRYVMVMGPYSIDFWANLDLLRGDVEEDNPNWTPAQVDEQLVLLSKAQSSFTILEITKKTDDKYEALLVFTVSSDSSYFSIFDDDNSTATTDGRKAHRLVQFEKNGDKIKATVNSVEDPGSFYGIYKTATDARAVTDFSHGTSSALVFQPWSDID